MKKQMNWNSNKEPNQIDLHGVKHHYVREILEKYLLGYHNTEGWEIITGNSPLMIEIVEDWLGEYFFDWDKGPYNYGKIIIIGSPYIGVPV